MPAIGQVPISPAVTAPIPLGAISATSIASLTTSQQDSIVRGTIVVTPTQSYVYTGYGSKTDVANYVALIGVSLDLPAHEADTTNIHGIANTAQLATLTNLSDHSADETDVHGILDTSQLATKTEASNTIPRFLYGWPASNISGGLGGPNDSGSFPMEPSFIGSSVLYTGSELSGIHTMYVPIFIGNSIYGSPRLCIPRTGGGTHIVKAAVLGADSTTGGFLTPVFTWTSATLTSNPEDGFLLWSGGLATSFPRGHYFIALRFETGGQNGIYVMDTSITANSRPTFAETFFRLPAQGYNHYEANKIIRVGSILRRSATPYPSNPWPPTDDGAPLHPCSEFTNKIIAQFSGPTNTPSNGNSQKPTFVTQAWNATIERQNDAVFPGPTLNSSAVSPDGGLNYLASANPGAFNASTSTRFEVTITPSNPLVGSLFISSFQLYSRSTSSGPLNVRVELTDNSGSVIGSQTFSVLNNSSWTLLSGGSLSAAQIWNGAPCKIRVYGYGGSATSGSGNWRIDGLSISGSYTSGNNLYTFSDILPLFFFGFQTITIGGGSGP